METITAIATGAGPAGVGIIRLSGERAIDIASGLFRGGQPLDQGESHRLYYGDLLSAEQEVLDRGLAVVMRSPKSFTGEDVVEFHAHGGPYLLRQILGAVLASGARLARPGEFTERAFLNGRLDLAQAEAVHQLILAEAEAERRAALIGLQGGLGEQIQLLRSKALDLLVQWEARNDYPEEDWEEVPASSIIQEILKTGGGLLSTAREGKFLREGIKVVIVGRPNVGKSSLLNALLREERAIVSQIPGTTRDLVHEVISLGGYRVRLMDTAGIRETSDLVEEIGVERSWQAASQADLILLVFDASQSLQAEDLEIACRVREYQGMVILNKTDLPVQLDGERLSQILPGWPVVETSLLSGSGVESLEEALIRWVQPGVTQGPVLASLRQEEALRLALSHLREVEVGLGQGCPSDLLSIDLRDAVAVLGEITGESVSESVIREIFSRFCLGK